MVKIGKCVEMLTAHVLMAILDLACSVAITLGGV